MGSLHVGRSCCRRSGDALQRRLRLIVILARRANSRPRGAGPCALPSISAIGGLPRACILTVGFLDGGSVALHGRILEHLNAWSKKANVRFREAKTDPDVRITRVDSPPDDAGYWSYVGTEILGIPADEPTMNLDSFTARISEVEYRRVVRHEAGHTLGFEHEHMRREFVRRIDVQKANRYFKKTDGWTVADVRAQVLTPLEEVSIMGTPPDENSIMCYQIPAEITKDGQPIAGGLDIDKSDFAFAASIYPKRHCS